MYDSSSPSTTSYKHKQYPEACIKRDEILTNILSPSRRNSNSSDTTTVNNNDDETSKESFSDKSNRKFLSPDEMENLAAQDGRFLISAEKLGPFLQLEKMSIDDQEREYKRYLTESDLPDV